jgi:hypothetical protein
MLHKNNNVHHCILYTLKWFFFMFSTSLPFICICIEYVVVPGKRFLYNGRERRPDFIGAAPLGRSLMPQGTLRMQLCLVYGSNV